MKTACFRPRTEGTPRQFTKIPLSLFPTHGGDEEQGGDALKAAHATACCCIDGARLRTLTISVNRLGRNPGTYHPLRPVDVNCPRCARAWLMMER